MLLVIVSTKLAPTAAPDFAIARPRLVRSLDAVWDHRVAVVAAPAGYGKSVALSQWHAADRRGPVAWLSLDERDRDPVRMGRHLLASLAEVDPDLGDRAGNLLASPAAGLGDEVVDLVLDDLAGLGTEIVVVLEDLDHLEGQPVLSDLGRLVMEAPPHVHFVLAARRDPNLPTHRLRVTGRLLELREDELRFSPAEAAELVRRLGGHELDGDAADQLLHLTEGWPVAVQLAALSLRGAGDASAIARFGATDRGIVDYLSAELLGRLRPDMRSFLLDVSVLHELDPGLCDSVTGRTDAADLIAELRQRSLFVVPSGDGPDGHRLHRLVRAFLQHDLAVDDPARPALLRRRAAEWCLDRDDPGQAAEYLMAARAWDPLLDVIHRHARPMWDQGHVETARGWVQAVPQEIRRDHTWLRLTEAALHLLAGRPEAGASVVAAVERDGALAPGEQVVADVLACTLVEVTRPDPAALERAERALAALDGIAADDIPPVLQATDPDGLRCNLHFLRAKTRLYLDVAGALGDAATATRAPVSAPPIYLVQAFGTRALIEALAHRGAATASAQRSLDLAAEHLGAEHPALLPAEVALAVAARNRDALDDADALGEAALARAVRWRRQPMVGLIIGERALVDLARGAPEAALARLHRYPQLSAEPLSPMVAGRLLAVERRARAALGALGDRHAAEWAGPAVAGWELAYTEVALAVDADDPGRARKLLDTWPTACSPLGDVEGEIATALVERCDGAAAAARARIADVLATAAPDCVVGPFAMAGGPAVPLLAAVARARPSRQAEIALAAARRAAGDRPQLVDSLSARELDVLRLLPSRLSNADIGRALLVSTNTVKTHLRHIYEKLGVTDREGAIRRAHELLLIHHDS